MALQDTQNDWMGVERCPGQGNKYEMIVSLDVSSSDSDTQDLFLFSECTACEVPSEWCCRSAQSFVVDFVAALPSCDSVYFSHSGGSCLFTQLGEVGGPSPLFHGNQYNKGDL